MKVADSNNIDLKTELRLRENYINIVESSILYAVANIKSNNKIRDIKVNLDHYLRHKGSDHLFDQLNVLVYNFKDENMSESIPEHGAISLFSIYKKGDIRVAIWRTFFLGIKKDHNVLQQYCEFQQYCYRLGKMVSPDSYNEIFVKLCHEFDYPLSAFNDNLFKNNNGERMDHSIKYGDIISLEIIMDIKKMKFSFESNFLISSSGNKRLGGEIVSAPVIL